MDRPTFDLLFARETGAKIEEHLKRISRAAEPDASALGDVKALLERVSIHRQNRNTVLHKMRVSDLDQLDGLLSQVAKTQREILAFENSLSHCAAMLSRFISQRDALETPDGVNELPETEISIPVYQGITWPPKPKKLELEEQ